MRISIGILKCGHLPRQYEDVLPSYAAMIRTALGSTYKYREFDAEEGELPNRGQTMDAYVITGSASSVYDSQPWITGVKEWIRALDQHTPLVGICFGHQVMAEALGGKVEKSLKGWALGLHEYTVAMREEWMDEATRFCIPVSHYDQVVEMPPDSHVLARSDFCPYAALTYEKRRALSFQGHPEFDLSFAATVIDRCRERGSIDAEMAEQARASLRGPNDRARVIHWMRRFLAAR